MKRILIIVAILASFSGCAKVGETAGKVYRSVFPPKDEKTEEKQPLQGENTSPEKSVTRLTGNTGDPAATKAAEIKPAAKPDVKTEKEKIEKVTLPKAVEKKEIAEPVKPVYSYNPRGKRDPFKLPSGLSVGGEKKLTVAGMSGGKAPGEIDFAKFQLKATMNLNGWTATLEDSSGKGVILRMGDVFGGAKVVSITSDTITLRRLKVLSEGQERNIILQKVKAEGGK